MGKREIERRKRKRERDTHTHEVQTMTMTMTREVLTVDAAVLMIAISDCLGR